MDSQQNDDKKFMQAALSEALNALNRGEVPIGAVVVCGGRVISRGHNLVETLGDATAHAEMQAITSASNQIGGKYLNECTLYVTVEPCIMCAGATAWSQIGRIVYGTADSKRGFTSHGNEKLLHPKTKVTAGVLDAECAELMTTFFKSLRKDK